MVGIIWKADRKSVLGAKIYSPFLTGQDWRLTKFQRFSLGEGWLYSVDEEWIGSYVGRHIIL